MQKTELIVFIGLFFLLAIRLVPSMNKYLRYDKEHYFKYKYIITVIYDMIGIIAIPLGITVLNTQVKDISSMFLFILTLVLLVIVALLKYKITRIYNDLPTKLKTNLINFKKPYAQVILQIYLLYAMTIPLTLLASYFNKGTDVGSIIGTMIYTCCVVYVFKVVNSSKVISSVHKILENMGNEKFINITVFINIFVITFLFVATNLNKIDILSKIIIAMVISSIMMLLLILKSSSAFTVYCIGKYKIIENNKIMMYDNTTLIFNIINAHKSDISLKYIGCIDLIQLFKLRIIHKKYCDIAENKIIKIDDKLNMFNMTVNDIRKKERKTERVTYLTFILKNNELLYQPIILA